jgi:hypothetical protein
MTGWRVHAWVLLSNHYHLMIETPEPNLVAGMKWLQNTLTRRFNVRHRAWGRVFGDRYKAKRTRSRAYRGTALRQAHGLEQAQRWLKEGLEAAGLAQEDLPRVRGSNQTKVSLAQLLWSRTTVTQEWLAEKLQMRSAANVSQLLRRAALKARKRQPPHRLADFINRALQEAD